MSWVYEGTGGVGRGDRGRAVAVVKSLNRTISGMSKSNFWLGIGPACLLWCLSSLCNHPHQIILSCVHWEALAVALIVGCSDV